MQRHVVGLAAAAVLLVVGCGGNENTRLADLAERSLEHQSANEARNAQLHEEVAEGTRHLIEADATAREAIVQLHRDIQQERAEFAKQRDLLETDRRALTQAKLREPIIAEAIKAAAMLMVCLVPLLIAVQILRRSDEPDQQVDLTEFLLEDLASDSPKLLQLHGSTQDSNRSAPPRLTDRTKGRD